MIIKDDKNVVGTKQTDSYFKTFYSDFIVITFSILILLAIGTMVLISFTGSREDGLVYGLFCGLGLGLIIFYYLRGQFNFICTIIQLTINAALSVVEFLGISFLLKHTRISELSYGYVLIFISVPTLISLNKQLLDSLAKKLNAQKREKQPLQIL